MRRPALVDSLAGRIAMLLTAGTILAVAASLLVAEQARRGDFRRLQGERVLASAADMLTRLERDPARTLAALDHADIIGAYRIDAATVPGDGEAMPARLLAQRLPRGMPARLRHVGSAVCAAYDPFWRRQRVAGFERPAALDCWVLSTAAAGRPLLVGLGIPVSPVPPSIVTSPVFLLSVFALCLALSLVAARLAGRPLRRLTAASRAFARTIDAEPVPEIGPRDVREALATFNLMQARVRDGVRERTRLLAAIGHDLQTPLTRLRLRLEQVEDAELRERLVADLSATLRMVRRGLDLARGGESHEDWAVVDLDSLLASLADDAAEFGHDARFASGCGARIRTRPDALTRCLRNLVDNAVKYGGSAELRCERMGDQVLAVVRDRGPGMAPAFLARAFEPFVRADTAADAGEGSGIGLAIARAQARAIGGTLSLANHRDGGLEAVLALPEAPA